MSRAATATPPPQPYFPQRNTTPTMRHCAAPTVSAAHFAARSSHQHHHSGRRKTKNLPSTSSNSPLKKNVPVVSYHSLDSSFESISIPSEEVEAAKPSITRQNSVSSYSSASSLDSYRTSLSRSSCQNLSESETDTTSTRITDSVSSFLSQAPTQLVTPASSEASLIQHSFDTQSFADSENATSLDIPAQSRASWVGKMAKAVVNTGMSIGIPFGQHGEKKARVEVTAPATPPPQVPSAPLIPTVCPALPPAAVQPSQEELQSLSLEQQLVRKREWAEAENRRVAECARLCSQWPQSGYNLSKYGPNGSNNFYSPQSYVNPQHVAYLMQKQAELERRLAANASMFFSCQREHRDTSDDESDPSVESYQSSLNSPIVPPSMSADEDLAAAMNDQKTAADIQAAMASPIMSLASTLSSSPKVLKAARSLPELDSLANSIVPCKDESAMDIDPSDNSLSTELQALRQVRARSCGAKRPAVTSSCEEKRRRVDEAMVVEEAVNSGVIMPNPEVATQNRMSSSVPDLAKARVAQAQAQGPPAVFGHVVKTSDTHPIIISPFFPVELLPILSQHMVLPPANGPFSKTPLLLSSAIDVPSLLLSYAPPIPNAALVPSPVQSTFRQTQLNQQRNHLHPVGNLLLSSCPGKRLRMDGPSRGRGPVCRDLATDLRRIKSEGVGCLVCCLDDDELSLLGVPWETYREVAAETGLDVIRLPMPDGFTPVSMSLFDSQVTLIATKYSLQGINVLVHCRGGVGRAGLTACAWAIKMGFVQPHPSLAVVEEAAVRQARSRASSQVQIPSQLEHQIIMSVVERVIAMLRARRGMKAVESYEQVQFLAGYVGWLRDGVRSVA